MVKEKFRILHDSRGYHCQRKFKKKVWIPKLRWWPARLLTGVYEEKKQWETTDLWGRRWHWCVGMPMPPSATFDTLSEAEHFIEQITTPPKVVKDYRKHKTDTKHAGK